MKKVLLIVNLAVGFAACNDSNNSQSSATADSANHSAHSSDNAQRSGGKNHMKAMHDAMNNSMQQMQGMKPSGDPDYDFAMMMKHHHQGAIDMAKAEIAGGSDAHLKQMAQKMIDEQQKENAQFDQFIQGKQPKGNSDYGQKAMGMMTPMSDIKMESGSLDAMFASMMIPHHQDAVKMAQEYLRVGKDKELKKMAKNITETQPEEVQELQNWLNAHRK
jgi:uncharacterized protein (DUF305 family)